MEADIARNFKVVCKKFKDIVNQLSSLSFEIETINNVLATFDKKFESIEKRMAFSSERDEDMLKINDSLNKKFQILSEEQSKFDSRLHDIEIHRMSEETSRAEILSTSLPSTEELISLIKSHDERIKMLESKVNRNEERTKNLESMTQNSHRNESEIERRIEEIAGAFRCDLENICEQLEATKQEVKSEIYDDFPKYEDLGGLEQQIKQLKRSDNDLNNRLSAVEKELEAGVVSNELQEDLRQLKQLSFSIGKINDTFKEDVFRLENQIKENSIKFMDYENSMTSFKSELDQKHSKLKFDIKTHDDRLEYLDQLLNELLSIVKKHSMNEKVNNIQQINHSMMYNAKESRPDLSASCISRNTEIPTTTSAFDKRGYLEIWDKFTKFDQALYDCLTLIEKEKVVINSQEKSIKNVDSRVKQMEKIMMTFQEHLNILFSKVDTKHSGKNSGSKKQDTNNMESLIETHIMQNLKKFDRVLNNMMNYEKKISDIDSRLKTLDTQMKENLSRGPDGFSTYQNPTNDERPTKEIEQESDDEHEEQDSISNALKNFKQNRPEIPQNHGVSPDYVKFVEMTQKGRNTA